MERGRAFDWFRQARDDLLWARDTLAAGRYAQACFASQQVAEKAIKAMARARGSVEVRSHSILEIARAMGVDGEIARLAGRLDQYYISARYPDALPAGAPFEYFSREQGDEAVAMAARMLEIAAREFTRELDEERAG